ncbi:hypothetical protein [Vibrio phage XZ1]|uniref:Uncharacterized protein n=3 Tax=Schizotequatrovirus TaxID=1198137 RepID=A0A126HGX9_9CAUD|nr:hypothetical protein AVU32_gp108 [Vibrio phage ValKK3]ALP47129.1 hypothetical protein phiGrn1_0265 [Vibrio phage phi-Grn1]ALP47514.1 hypothetical protein phiST2_0024 [Vibrio phage phi-ST2]QBX06318.1 hypothetical protein Va3_365 [Vibrio phage Va3]QNJ54946.1 hypothetical protein vBValMR11Z_20 [Vibrio phage vB_ValM_R11Z]UOL51375.1 hypothetical protein [Vibrio phage XZ1]
MITLIQDQNSLQFMFNDDLLLSATWESYIDQNYNCEMYKTAMVEIPSIGCTVVREKYDARNIIETLLKTRELEPDEFELITDLFPHVDVTQEEHHWHCECCGGVHDTTTNIFNQETGKELEFHFDGHFGDSTSLMPHQLLEFCLYGWLIDQ